ncbi:unnamed protein product, partial [Symbiodinium sp. CCMP2592]
VRILKKKKAGSGNEAVQARLHGVPGAWSQPEEGDEAGALILNQYVPGAKAEAGTRPERLSSTNVESQVRDLGPKKVKVGCLKPEEGELQEEATTSSKDLLSEYVLGAWSQPEEDRGGDKAGVPILNQYGVPGARSQLEEDGGGNQAWKLKMKKGKDKVCGLSDKAERAYPECVVSVEEGGGRDEAGALILTNMGSQVRGLSPKKATRPAQYGVPGAWSQPEEGGGGDEAGTRPERLSSTNVESQVRDLGPKKVKVGCLKPEEGELQEEATTSSKDLLSEYVLGAWSQPEEDRGGDKAGVPILNQYGVPGARSQLEEDGGGNQAGALLLNQYRVRGAWSQLEQDGGRDKAGRLILNRYGVPRCGSSSRRRQRQGQSKVWKLEPQPMWLPRCVVSATRPREQSSTKMGCGVFPPPPLPLSALPPPPGAGG